MFNPAPVSLRYIPARKPAKGKAMRLPVIAMAVLLIGCDGTMRGMVRGSGQPITFAYKMQPYDDELAVTLPEGENFRGKAVPVGHSRSVGTTTAHNGKEKQTKAVSQKVVETSTGQVEAVLFGDRGRSMRCDLKYADAGGAIIIGGVGVCNVSDGQVIDVAW